MTATPTQPDYQKFGRALRKAGGTFGIDLAGLFEDEDGNAEGIEGFSPTFSLTSQLKGRSPSTMTYKAPKTPSATAVFTLAPKLDSPVTATPSAPQEEKKEVVKPVEEKADKLLSSFIGPLGRPGAIGLSGITRAADYGYSKEDILGKAQTENLKFGEDAARALGLNTNASSYIGPRGTQGALGLSAVQRMQSAGLANEAIRSLAQQQGLKFGSDAAQFLGVSDADTYKPPAPAPAPQVYSGAPLPNYNPSGSLNQYIGSQGTAGALGANAVQRAMAAGLSASQIKQQAAQQGLTFGANALSLLQ